MEYNLALHGDVVEREFSDFITTYLPNYSNVWKTFIGNKGNDTMASIEGYHDEEKRMRFWEQCYTVLESVVVLKRMMDRGAFEGEITSFNAFMDFKADIVLFFAMMGRIYDNMEHAATYRGAGIHEMVISRLQNFYFKRHCVVHGKTLPVRFDSKGRIEIPVLSNNSDDRSGWNHKTNKWEDVFDMKTEPVHQTINQLFWSLLTCVDSLFGIFFHDIKAALDGRAIHFEYQAPVKISVYGIHGSSKTMAPFEVMTASGMSASSNNTANVIQPSNAAWKR